MKRILISGYHGFGNCGDEAILSAMVNNLKHIYPDLEIIALSKKPQETARVYGINAIYRINIFSIFNNMLNMNVLLSGGGSLLQDVTSTRSLIYYLSIIAMAKFLKKPVILYANGIGPIKKKFNRFLTSKIVDQVDIITLRDEESKYELEKLGITKPKIEITADPVFTLEAIYTRQIARILKAEQISLDKPLIGISIRKWKSETSYERTIAEVADGIIEKYDCNILFIPMQMPEDSKVIERVRRIMRNHSVVINGRYNVQEYMGIIGNLELLISMRLHPLIFAAVQKIPMIGLIYDPKVRNFLELVEQPSGGNITNLNKDLLYELIDYILKNKDKISQTLERHIVDLRRMAEKNDNIVIEFLEKE